MPSSKATISDPTRLRVGLDFDNTIVCYDRIFHKVASELGLLPPFPQLSKDGVRNLLRSQGREAEWTELQGLVYGSRILDAEPFPGALEFIAAGAAEFDLFVISHKTRTPYAGAQYDLHQAARSWLMAHGVLGTGSSQLPEAHVFFELTLADKLNRIKAQRCDVFIDDLPELLTAPDFPTTTRRFLFDPLGQNQAQNSFVIIGAWHEFRGKINERL